MRAGQFSSVETLELKRDSFHRLCQLRSCLHEKGEHGVCNVVEAEVGNIFRDRGVGKQLHAKDGVEEEDHGNEGKDK